MYNAESLKKGITLSILSAYDFFIDAKANYMQCRYAACICLMTTAREEVGKARILKKIMDDLASGEITKNDVLLAINKHMEKLRSSICLFNVPVPAELLKRYQDACLSQDSLALKMASDEIDVISAATKQQLPGKIHKKRMVAQYVDPIGDGNWNSRYSITLDDCYTDLINLGSEVVTDMQFLLGDVNCDGELASRGINFNTIHSLVSEFMMEIHGHKKTTQQS